MQVPEKLSLIGGSILLASTLIFTLKSQASTIIPKVGDSIGSVYQDITNTDAEHGGMSFEDAFKNAQKQHWQTGTWGTAKYYVDKDMNMHVGGGTMDRDLYDAVGDKVAHSLHTITLDENIKAPQSSDNLFRGSRSHYPSNINPADATNMDKNDSITGIYGLDRLDTSQATSMNDVFYQDHKLSNDLAVGDWDTSHVTDMRGLFGATNISQVNVKNWDVHNVIYSGWMFAFDGHLDHLDLGNWHTNNLKNISSMFASDNGLKDLDMGNFDTTQSIRDDDYIFGASADWDKPDSSLTRLILGDKTQIKADRGLTGTWKNGDQTLSSTDLTSAGLNGKPTHPGTWIRQ